MKPYHKRATFNAAKNMDWEQVVCNGGPPCFHMEGGRFCGRAERWDGHDEKYHGKDFHHDFISLETLLKSI